MKKQIFLFLSIVLLVSLLTGCGSGGDTVSTPTTIAQPPDVNLIVNPNISDVLAGQTVALSVNVSGQSIKIKWTVARGALSASEGPAVLYTPPNTAGVDTVTVEVSSVAGSTIKTVTFNVQVPATDTPLPLDTPTPTLTPGPAPTQWACTSSRSQKLQSADIPGQVIIDTPQQGTIGVPSRQDVQVRGSYTGVPQGKYLWVFIYSPDAGLHGRYYPQTRDAAQGWQPDPTTEQGGAWSLKIKFGAKNLCYEIIVMAADANASQLIAEQLQKWAAVKDYTGYELNGPATADPPNAPGFPTGLVEKASIEVKTR